MPDFNPVLAVIPARYGSTRFPGKPLADILDKPMIQWVVEAAEESTRIDDVLVATDDERIREAVEHTGAQAVMTPRDLASGSDRVARVVRSREADLIVNVQGDEPLITGDQLDRGVDRVRELGVGMGSFMAPLDPDLREDPDVVKVVVDDRDRALYFSRSPIPHTRGEPAEAFQHVGIYTYRREVLLSFADAEPTPLERSEKLEQLRVLERGGDIAMTRLEEATVGVDRPEDVPVVESRLRQRDEDS